MRLAPLLLLAALPAYSAPGFFRDPGDRVFERNVIKASTVCTVTVSYDAGKPAGVEVDELTVPCYATTSPALLAASNRAKVFVLGEPARPPQYECAVAVAWDPVNPSAPAITLSGDGPCSATESAALAAAARITLN